MSRMGPIVGRSAAREMNQPKEPDGDIRHAATPDSVRTYLYI
jgi:hypothetical protein